MIEQEVLLKIVKTWKINPKPEYRYFRCANCQCIIHKAWFHWLNLDGFKLAVHLCNRCQDKLKRGKIEVTKSEVDLRKIKFLDYPDKVKNQLKKDAKVFPIKDKPKYRPFTCDRCHKNIWKAFHVWAKQENALVELHYCIYCGYKLDLDKL